MKQRLRINKRIRQPRTQHAETDARLACSALQRRTVSVGCASRHEVIDGRNAPAHLHTLVPHPSTYRRAKLSELGNIARRRPCTQVLGAGMGAPAGRTSAGRIWDRNENGHLCAISDNRQASAQRSSTQRHRMIELRRVGQYRAEPYREQGAMLSPQFGQDAIVPKQIGDGWPRTNGHVTDDGGNWAERNRAKLFARKALDAGAAGAARCESVHANAHVWRARVWARRRSSTFLRSSLGSTRSAAQSRTDRRA